MTTKARTMSQLRKDEELADMTRKSKICVQWMEEKLGAPLPNQNLREALLDGVVLCKLANILKPGCIRQFHRQPRMLMMKMENIAFFLTACKTRLSVPQATLFAPTDVHDDSDPANMLKVLRVLLLLRGDFPGTSTEEATVGEFEEVDEIAEPSPDDHADPAPGGEDAALSAASAAAAAAKAAAEAAMAQAAALQAEAEAARAAATAAAEARRVAAEKAAADAAAERARLERERAEQDRLDKERLEKERQAVENAAAAKAAAVAAVAAEKAAAAERALAAAEKAAAEKAAAAAAAAKVATSSGGSDNLAGPQPELLSEITSAIHSELSLESKLQLLTTLAAQVRAVQAKIMAASDSELRSLCFESGLGSSLADVPAGKPRSFYVEWLLKNGRLSA